MANRRGLSDLIKEEANKAALTAEENTETTAAAEAAGTTEQAAAAELAEKDKIIAKLEQSLEKAKTELEAAQKEVMRLIDENKQLQSRPGLAPKASLPTKSTASGEMVVASGILIAHAHKRGKVLIPDLVVNQDAENNKDFAANAWML
jgi:multidrug efflux pump subunit AcrA (membrane-fusion protein)